MSPWDQELCTQIPTPSVRVVILTGEPTAVKLYGDMLTTYAVRVSRSVNVAVRSALMTILAMTSLSSA